MSICYPKASRSRLLATRGSGCALCAKIGKPETEARCVKPTHFAQNEILARHSYDFVYIVTKELILWMQLTLPQ